VADSPGAVDLRLGVETIALTDDHEKQALVLKVCLEDVRRCRPFLVVLVGDRYGWVPPTARADAALTEAGFATSYAGKSVTAMEVRISVFGRSSASHPEATSTFASSTMTECRSGLPLLTPTRVRRFIVRDSFRCR